MVAENLRDMAFYSDLCIVRKMFGSNIYIITTGEAMLSDINRTHWHNGQKWHNQTVQFKC